VTPSPADPTPPPAPIDLTASSPVKHPPAPGDPSTSSDGNAHVVTSPNDTPVAQPAAAAFTNAPVSAVADTAGVRALTRTTHTARVAPPSLQSSPVAGLPSDGTPAPPAPVAPFSPRGNDGPFLAFEAGASPTPTSHGSSNVLPFAAVLVMLGIICGPLLRRAQRFISVPPRLNFAFAFERPG
jgi:hypothetical protein